MRALFTASRGHCGGLGALETWSRLGDGAGRGVARASRLVGTL